MLIVVIVCDLSCYVMHHVSLYHCTVQEQVVRMRRTEGLHPHVPKLAKYLFARFPVAIHVYNIATVVSLFFPEDIPSI